MPLFLCYFYIKKKKKGEREEKKKRKYEAVTITQRFSLKIQRGEMPAWYLPGSETQKQMKAFKGQV